jgi:hypothetical protein
MAAGKYSFAIEQGATVQFEIQYKDSSNQPIDLSGHTARMQIRPDYADNTATTYANLTTTLDPDGTGLNMSGSSGTTPLQSGSIGIYISAVSSSAFTFNEAKYDLEIVSGSVVTRILEGCIKLRKEVTR